MFKLSDEVLREEREEGREEGLLEVARTMLSEGFPIDRIAKLIKMPVEWLQSRLVQA